jgi:flagellar hook-basal body complex protein FliE
VNSRNNRGAGVLFAAVYAISDDAAEPKLLSALLGRGADPRARSKSGKSCLDVINEMIESVNAKIEAGQRLTASLSEKEKVELEKNVAEILAPFEKAKAILEAAIEHRKGKEN